MGEMIIKAGKVFTGETEKLLENVGIRIVDDTIAEIKPIGEFSGKELVDYGDKVLMPGMFNCHVHLGTSHLPNTDPRNKTERVIWALQNLKDLLESGVTTVRNQGSPDLLDVHLRDMVREGQITGPNIVACGNAIVMTGGHGWKNGLQSDGADECRKNARWLIREGVDSLKMMATGGVMTPNVLPGSPQLTYDELAAICDEARKAQKFSSSHAQGSEGILNVVKAGITTVEHGIYLTDEIIGLMLEKGTWLCPTLAAVHFIVINGEGKGIPEYAVQKAKMVESDHMKSFEKAVKAGVKIAMGTDAGTPFNEHKNSWYEFKLMKEHGLSSFKALQAGTIKAAEMLKLDGLYGSIREGKKADLVVLNENPLENIETLQHIAAVYKHGKKVK
ncbi:MAG: amidohydrolase family protein [Fusobacteriaceae bacterium]|jgi:imidazolonepropionase-like amidohydrolase|nr:amidohydrolase family protein [Fusobacteriaceae bacterium]